MCWSSSLEFTFSLSSERGKQAAFNCDIVIGTSSFYRGAGQVCLHGVQGRLKPELQPGQAQA